MTYQRASASFCFKSRNSYFSLLVCKRSSYIRLLTLSIIHKYFSHFFICHLIFMVAFAMSAFKVFVKSSDQLFPLWIFLWLMFQKRTTLLSCFLLFMPLFPLFTSVTAWSKGLGREVGGMAIVKEWVCSCLLFSLWFDSSTVLGFASSQISVLWLLVTPSL